MKYIKKFENSDIWTKQIIEERFQYVFDLCESYSIELGMFDDGDWYSVYNDYSEQAYLIEISHNFFDKSTFDDFVKFNEILNEIKISLEELNSSYKPSYIGFIENSNSKISIVIKP
jgi:hypothetical protein